MKKKNRLLRKAVIAPLILLPLAIAPSAAIASRTDTSARTHDLTYRDRTPHIHDGIAPKPHHHKKH